MTDDGKRLCTTSGNTRNEDSEFSISYNNRVS